MADSKKVWQFSFVHMSTIEIVAELEGTRRPDDDNDDDDDTNRHDHVLALRLSVLLNLRVAIIRLSGGAIVAHRCRQVIWMPSGTWPGVLLAATSPLVQQVCGATTIVLTDSCRQDHSGMGAGGSAVGVQGGLGGRTHTHDPTTLVPSSLACGLT
jgi:hypothetical protein